MTPRPPRRRKATQTCPGACTRDGLARPWGEGYTKGAKYCPECRQYMDPVRFCPCCGRRLRYVSILARRRRERQERALNRADPART